VFVVSKAGPFYGVSGTTSVYKPEVFLGQDSSSHLYVQNGVNKISVGWHVSFNLSFLKEVFIYLIMLIFFYPKNMHINIDL